MLQDRHDLLVILSLMRERTVRADLDHAAVFEFLPLRLPRALVQEIHGAIAEQAVDMIAVMARIILTGAVLEIIRCGRMWVFRSACT